MSPTEPLDRLVGLGGATGVGSMPGSDPVEAAAVVVGELPDLPHLPELPGRGPAGDLIGRAAALLAGLHVDLQPSGWRLVPRPGMDERRAASYLSQDLDALEEAAQGYTGPLKVQVAGPWTVMAALQLHRGEPVLADAGARRDLVASLAEGAALHVADVRRRLPGATVLLQLDEPSLPTVLAGHIRSMSGLNAFPPPPDHEAEAVLRSLMEGAAGAPVVIHCCAAEPPVDLMRRAGAAAVSVDLTVMGQRCDDALGEALENGLALFAGVVPAVGGNLSDPAATVDPVRRLWQRLGFSGELLAGESSPVVVTPTCGLAGASPEVARAVLAHCRSAAAALVDDPEG